MPIFRAPGRASLRPDLFADSARIYFSRIKERFERKYLKEAKLEITRRLAHYWERAEGMGKTSLLEIVEFFKHEFMRSRMAYTPYHSRQVAKLTLLIALECGLPSEKAFQYAAGGYLHDVGKILIPEWILGKEEKTGKRLLNAEKEFIRAHAEYGDVLLSQFRCEEAIEVRRIIRSHQEMFSGAGYPDRLTGVAIPLGARMVKIADSLSAMASHRFYRNKLYSLEDAAAVLLKQAGMEFDPALVKLTIRALYRIPENELERLIDAFAGKEFHSSIQNVLADNIRKIPLLKLRRLMQENGLACTILRPREMRRKALRNAYVMDEHGLRRLLEECGIEYNEGGIAGFQKYINKENRRLSEWDRRLRSTEERQLRALYELLELGEVSLEPFEFTFLS